MIVERVETRGGTGENASSVSSACKCATSFLFFLLSFFFLSPYLNIHALSYRGQRGGGEGYRLTILGDLVSELGRVREEWGVEHYLRKGYLKKLTAK